MVKRSFWLVRHLPVLGCVQPELAGGDTYKKTANVMTSPGVMGRSRRCIFTQEHRRIMQICCLGDRIGDIELKGGVLDFGKLARLVCQPTQRHSCLLLKKF